MQKTIKQTLDAMLARREYSSHEVVAKLRMAGYIDASIFAIIEDYQQKGLLSNDRYTEEKVYSLIRKGYGPNYVSRLLSQQGLSFNISDYCWNEAKLIARRKAGSREGVKLKQYMFRRGFSHV